jgi:hypothetical protein
MARAKMKAKDLQRLMKERDKLFLEMQALRNKIEGLELAMTVLEKEDDGDETSGNERAGRGKTKELVLSLLKQAGTTGLNAVSAVEMAKTRGFELARGTAASTLSRLKADGVAKHDGERYRLAEFERPRVAIVGVASTGSAGTLKTSQS